MIQVKSTEHMQWY